MRCVRSSGFSLIEVTMALAIFMVVMAGVMEAMTTSNRLTTQAVTHTDLQLSEKELIRSVTSDLAMSGWNFHPTEDQDGDGVLDSNEDLDGSGTLTDVVYNVSGDTPVEDRRLRYYPFVNVATAELAGRGFRSRQYPAGAGGQATFLATTLAPSAAAVQANGLSRLSPWPADDTGAAAASAATILARATAQDVLLTQDLAEDMAAPSSDLIYLRVATGPWSADPGEAERRQSDDMRFFPGFGGGTPPPGASAQAWNTPDNHANLPGVLFPSEYELLPGGGFRHRNATDLVAATDMYGVRAWGAMLDDAAAGDVIRIQWEAIAADRVDLDRQASTDNEMAPEDLREFVLALVPSPIGLGRLVRAHAVIKPSGTTPGVGVEPGDWISDPAADVGWEIDRVLSDDVVRVRWTTRRHDRNLAVNEIRLNLVMAKVQPTGHGGSRAVISRRLTTSLTMWARNQYEDVRTAQSLIDVTDETAERTNVYLQY